MFPDFSRRLPVVDPVDRELYSSLGCALENLIIAAENMGYSTDVQYFPEDEPGECIRINLKSSTSALQHDKHLFKAISARQSTRSEYDSNQVPNADLKQIENVKTSHNISIQLFTDNKKKGKMLPLHAHPHEQTGYLIKGHILLIIDREKYEMKPGGSWSIPGNAGHGAEILEDSVAIEVFSPVREDYIP